MNPEQIADFKAAFEVVLQKAGLPPRPDMIIGRSYLFMYEHQSCQNALFGKVAAVEFAATKYSDEIGIGIQVTNRHFQGGKLISITYSPDGIMKWRVHMQFGGALSEENHKYFEGHFELL